MATEEDRPATRKWRRRLLGVGFGTLLACSTAEVALRVGGYDRTYANPLQSFHEADPLVGYRGKPNFRGRYKRPSFDVVVEHDARGFRKHEHQNTPADGSRNVFALGDSYTWGWGVDQGEVFSDQMNTLMPGYVVHNLGLNASGTVQQFALFERYVRSQLSLGDTVVVVVCGNDYADNVKDDEDSLHVVERDGKFVLVKPRAFGSKLKALLKDHSRVFNLVSYWTNLLKRKWRSRGGVARAIAQTQEEPAPALANDSLEVRVMTRFLARFHEECQEKKARLLVVDIGRDLNLPLIARAVGFELLTLKPTFDEAKKSGRVTHWLLRYDNHWNPQGHRLAAEAIAAQIIESDRAGEAGDEDRTR